MAEASSGDLHHCSSSDRWVTLYTFVTLGNNLPVIASRALSAMSAQRGNLVAGLEPAIVGLRNLA